MSASYCLIVADNVRTPAGSGARPGAAGLASYEPGHSERQVNGSVAVDPDSRWLATLAVPMTGDQSVLITLEREGPVSLGAPAVPAVTMVIPADEVEAWLALLRGLVAHARRDRVLTRRSSR